MAIGPGEPVGNAPPVAADEQTTTQPATPIAVDVTANDYDPDGNLDPATVRVVSLPSFGQVHVDAERGISTYVPATDYVGTDHFTYRVSDTQGRWDEADVTVEVVEGNRPPVANDDTAVTQEDAAVFINVVANDSDPEGLLDILTVRLLSIPARGAAQFDLDTRQVLYVPDRDFSGGDSFVYEVQDSDGLRDTAVVLVTVAPENDPPTARDDEAVTVEGTSVSISLLDNDSDIDDALDPASVFLLTEPASGQFSINPETGTLLYQPQPGFAGNELLAYSVSDGHGETASASIFISVSAGNQPPTALADHSETAEEQPVRIAVLANDFDDQGEPDRENLTIHVSPLNGSAVVDIDTGEVVYTPHADFNGTDWLEYRIEDQQQAFATALVVIDVLAVNDAPIANDDTAVVLAGQPVQLAPLVNDRDVDGQLARDSLVVTNPPTAGAVTLDGDGKLTYEPGVGFVTNDSFQYTVRDNEGAISNEATVVLLAGDPRTTSIQGRTFEDLNGDGSGDGDPGLAGFTIWLFDIQGQAISSTLTLPDTAGTTEDESGSYRFDDLAAGTYIVAEQLDSHWSQTYPPTGDLHVDQTGIAAAVHVVTVGIGVPATDVDFGNRTEAVATGTICGYVYADVNNNGIKDPVELALPNVPVTLEGPTQRVVVTDQDGRYRFENLPPGSYSVAEQQPEAFLDGMDTPGLPQLGHLQNDMFYGIDLAGDMLLEDYNFGERGLQPHLVGKHLFLASTPPPGQSLPEILPVTDGTLWVALRPDADTLLTARVTPGDGSTVMEIYTSSYMPVNLSRGEAMTTAPLMAGESYVLHVGGSETHPPQQVALTAAQLPLVPPSHNTVWALDVNADGAVNPLDALLVINELNRQQNAPFILEDRGGLYYDVNDDGLVAPIDALMVINYLNRSLSDGASEGESIDGEREPERLEIIDIAFAEWEDDLTS